MVHAVTVPLKEMTGRLAPIADAGRWLVRMAVAALVLAIVPAVPVALAEAESATAERQAVNQRFAVQLGSFRRLERALERLREIPDQFPDKRLVEANLPRNITVYRVVIGNFVDRKDAVALRRALRTQGVEDSYVVTVEAPPGRAATIEPAVGVPGEAEVELVRETGVVQAASPKERAVELSRRQDEVRPSEQFTTTFLGKPLTIGGEYEMRGISRRDFALDPTKEDDLTRLDQNFQLEFLYTFNRDLYMFLEGKAVYKTELHKEAGGRKDEDDLVRGQTWIYAGNLLGGDFAVQAGRQNFRDKREWWWDQLLDSVRFHYDHQPFSVELGFAEELAPTATSEENGDIPPDEDDIFRVMSRATWYWARKQRLELFAMHQNDHSDTPRAGDVLKKLNDDEIDGNLSWAGARALGRWKYRPLGRFHYWVDTAVVWGDEDVIDFDPIKDRPGFIVVDTVDSVDVQGWAFDLGVTWQQDRVRGKPSLTIGYAMGSGDSDFKDGKDRTFRQTGLQDNNARFRGVERMRYYGELLRPELSNLQIGTVGLGFRFLSKSSLDVVYHHYRQVDAADFLRNSRIGAKPQGEKRTIGDELDLVIGMREWKRLQLEFVAAVFEAGNAYGDLSGKRAHTALLSIEYGF